jgi:hypothetical protein
MPATKRASTTSPGPWLCQPGSNGEYYINLLQIKGITQIFIELFASK